MSEGINNTSIQLVRDRVSTLMPALASLGMVEDIAGLAMAMDNALEELEDAGVPREFTYRVLVGALATSLGNIAGAEQIEFQRQFAWKVLP